MKLVFKYLLGFLILVVGIFTVSYLQYRFDQSDLKHAVAAVREARPTGPHGPTLEEALARSLAIPADRISWVPTIDSKFKGTVVVQALIPQGGANLYWEVDLVRFSVKPITLEAERVSQNK